MALRLDGLSGHGNLCLLRTVFTFVVGVSIESCQAIVVARLTSAPEQAVLPDVSQVTVMRRVSEYTDIRAFEYGNREPALFDVLFGRTKTWVYVGLVALFRPSTGLSFVWFFG